MWNWKIVLYIYQNGEISYGIETVVKFFFFNSGEKNTVRKPDLFNEREMIFRWRNIEGV